MEGRREEERNPGQGNPGGKSVPDSYPVDLENLMVIAVERRASDLHLAPGMAPVVRINGELIRLDYPIMSSGDVAALLLPILEPYQQQYRRTMGAGSVILYCRAVPVRVTSAWQSTLAAAEWYPHTAGMTAWGCLRAERSCCLPRVWYW